MTTPLTIRLLDRLGFPCKWVGYPVPRGGDFPALPDGGGHVVVYWSWRVLRLGRWLSVDLHHFVRSDAEGCYHSHPAWAFRLVLAGEYLDFTDRGLAYTRRRFRRGSAGVVRPSTVHRIELVRGPCWSLWIQGPRVAPIYLHGPGLEALGLEAGQVSPIERHDA